MAGEGGKRLYLGGPHAPATWMPSPRQRPQSPKTGSTCTPSAHTSSLVDEVGRSALKQRPTSVHRGTGSSLPTTPDCVVIYLRRLQPCHCRPPLHFCSYGAVTNSTRSACTCLRPPARSHPLVRPVFSAGAHVSSAKPLSPGGIDSGIPLELGQRGVKEVKGNGQAARDVGCRQGGEQPAWKGR
jgi:hypothetical protein